MKNHLCNLCDIDYVVCCLFVIEGSISGDSIQNISSRLNASEELRESRALRSHHNKSVENLSRAPSATSHSDIEDKRSPSPQTPQPLSPITSEMSQGMCSITTTIIIEY